MAQLPVLSSTTPLLQHVAALPDSQWGPSMLALPVTLRAFVVARVSMRMSQREATRAAGSECRTDKALDVVGSRWAHDSRVLAAMYEETQKLIGTTAPEMVRVLQRVATSAKSRGADRVKAANSLLSMAGHEAVRQVEVRRGPPTPDRRTPSMRDLLAEAGLDPQLLTDDPGVGAIDAEFTELEAVGELAAAVPPVPLELDPEADDWAAAMDEDAADHAPAEVDDWTVIT